MKTCALTDELFERIGSLNPERQEKLLELVKQWQAEQKRQFERFEQSLDVGVGQDGRVSLGRARNLSAGGIYINLDLDFSPTHEVDLAFALPGSDRPFKLKGRVIRLDHDGIAVKFAQVTPYLEEALEQALRLSAKK